jgi:hypothetical protein
LFNLQSYLAANSRSWSSSKRAINSDSENETGFTRYEKEKENYGFDKDRKRTYSSPQLMRMSRPS